MRYKEIDKFKYYKYVVIELIKGEKELELMLYNGNFWILNVF